jgi:hypothetical protein
LPTLSSPQPAKATPSPIMKRLTCMEKTPPEPQLFAEAPTRFPNAR